MKSNSFENFKKKVILTGTLFAGLGLGTLSAQNTEAFKPQETVEMHNTVPVFKFTENAEYAMDSAGKKAFHAIFDSKTKFETVSVDGLHEDANGTVKSVGLEMKKVLALVPCSWLYSN